MGTGHCIFILPAPTYDLNFERNLWGLFLRFSTLDASVPSLPLESCMHFPTSANEPYAYVCIPTPSSIDIVAIDLGEGSRAVVDAQQDPFDIDIGLEQLRSRSRGKLIDLN